MRLISNLSVIVPAATSLLLATPAMGLVHLSEDGRIIVMGEGHAEAPPDFARLSVSVISICYETSSAAKDANAEIANQILETLRNFAPGQRDRVIATGGSNYRNTEYLSYGSRTETLCTRKWRATNTLILETADIEALPEIQDQLLATIDQFDQPTMDKQSQTYAELSQPSFLLYTETSKKLRSEAQQNAWEDAKLQFDNFASLCDFRDVRLTRIEPPTYRTGPIYEGDAQASERASTPIIPANLEVSATWKFTWTFDPAVNCGF